MALTQNLFILLGILASLASYIAVTRQDLESPKRAMFAAAALLMWLMWSQAATAVGKPTLCCGTKVVSYTGLSTFGIIAGIVMLLFVFMHGFEAIHE